MLTFDKLKIVASLNAVKICDEDRFEKTVKNEVVTAMNYYQSAPYLLRMKIDYERDEFVIEFTGKVLGKDYPKLISCDTIGLCFDNITALGIVVIDKEAMMNATVVKCDVSTDIALNDIPQLISYVRGHLRNYRKYLCRELKNGNLIIEKNVTDKDYKKRLTIYDKGKEMNMKSNARYIEANGLYDAFAGKCRFEMNLNTKEQIRKSLNISDTRLGTVLSARKNPIREFLDEVVKEDTEQIAISNKKSYIISLVLKDCDYDIAKVEAKMRGFHKRGTDIQKLMEPYRAALNGLSEQTTYSMDKIREQLQ